jgi:hypothetical protein
MSYWIGCCRYRLGGHWVWAGLLAGLGACQAQQESSALPAKVFRRGRQLTYQVKQVAPGHQPAPADTLRLTSFGDYLPGQYDSGTTQIKVGFSYDAHSSPTAYAGVVEQDSVLWSHPPRVGTYAILELSPFPYIKLPAAVGHAWTWDLGVGNAWSNPAWGNWRGVMNVHSTYRVMGQRVVKTRLGALTCWVVKARATCQLGTSSLELLYHPAYGFVELNYRTLNGGRIELALIRAGMVPLPTPFQPSAQLKMGIQPTSLKLGKQ